jgi:acetyl-CoA synthetase
MSGELTTYWLQNKSWDSYEQLREEFEWDIPDPFNLAAVLVDQWSEYEGPAIHAAEPDRYRKVTFAELHQKVNQLANFLASRGVGRGDRIGINAPQKPETLITHLAAWKLGAVSVPTSILFGEEGLRYRFADAGVDACIADVANLDTVRAVRDELSIETLLTVDVEEPRRQELDFQTVLADSSSARETVSTSPEDPALIVYTSGTTGEPKGVVHGHQMLLGQLPHFACSFCNLELYEEDVFYAPIEWAWIAMFNFVVPALFYRRPLVAYAGGPFDPETTYELLERFNVTCFGTPPTALRSMKTVREPGEEYDLSSVRVIETGGEALDSDLVDWATEVFDAPIHEHYGQTEADVVIGDCTTLSPRKQGAMGQVLPGHEITVVDPDTLEPTETGETGEIAISYEEDPVCFRQYLNKPEQTAKKVQNGWLLTGDLASVDNDGYYSFKGRKDGVIISAGYRIDPTEIEEILVTHESVRDAGVIGAPDDERGEVPKAFITLANGCTANKSLESELEEYVRDQLAQYEYPREWEYLDTLPKTITGKTDRSQLKNQ